MSEGEQLRRDQMAAEAYLAGQDQKSLKEEREDLRAELSEPIPYCSCCNRVIEEGFCPVCDVQNGS